VSDKVLDLRKCDYAGKNLSGKTLAGALLANADLSNSNLQEAVLTKVWWVEPSSHCCCAHYRAVMQWQLVLAGVGWCWLVLAGVGWCRVFVPPSPDYDLQHTPGNRLLLCATEPA
jgi:hypothetical protein